MKLKLDGDLVTGMASGHAVGVNLPGALVNIDRRYLRFDGINIVLGADYTAFFIDNSGIKHIIQHNLAWQALSCAFSDLLANDEGVWRVKTSVDYFKEAKALKKAEINAASSAALLAITSLYTREEIDSWPTQEAEAKAWNTDNAAASPFIDSLVANNAGIDKAGAVSKILTNAGVYKTASGVVIGKKQAFMDAVNALPDTSTQADLDGIAVSFA